MNITRISIERPTIAVVVFSLLIILGIFSYRFLTYELVPKFNPPVLTVTTIYPGASPDEVENNVATKIEDALSSLENIDVIIKDESTRFIYLAQDINEHTVHLLDNNRDYRLWYKG